MNRLFVLAATLLWAACVQAQDVNNPTAPSATIPQARVTLTTGTPVLTSTVAAATSVFVTPYGGNYLPIYNGSSYISTPFSEMTITLGSNWATVTNYDVFAAYDGTTLRACTGPAWTNSGAGTSTRGTGAGTTELERIKGVLTNKVSMTCRYNNTTTFTVAVDRGLYLGSFKTTAAGQVDYILGASSATGTAAVLNVWNYYNRQTTVTNIIATDTGTYTTNTIRQFLNSAGMQASFLIGVQEEGVQATFIAELAVPASVSGAGFIGLGFDVTNAFSVQRGEHRSDSATVSSVGAVTTPGIWNAGAGAHFISANQQGDGTNATEFNNSGTANLSVVVRN